MGRFAVYPGSFDPITNGHLNIIRRSLKVFEHLTVAVAVNSNKKPLFTPAERVAIINESVIAEFGADNKIEVEYFEGLIVNYADRKKADALVRGLRAVSDFEYEFQMAAMNHKLNPRVETFFMMTAEDQFYISSQTVKEVASLGGSVEGLVPENVKIALQKKFALKETV